MNTVLAHPSKACTNCGIPQDSEYFDVSGFADVPALNSDAVVLARFNLHHQYCGVLEFFSQFSDEYSRDPSRVETPGLQWLLLVNGRSLYPYIEMESILNPWGMGSFGVHLRLPEAARLEFSVRRTGNPGLLVKRLGARLSGRYWFSEG
jgi:hypothetical protein